jgi:hypothetical protein
MIYYEKEAEGIAEILRDLLPDQPHGSNQAIKTTSDNPLLLMCKDVAVYNVTQDTVLNEHLLPGCISRGTMTYTQWMRTRYSAGSNVSARRLMLKAFGTDNHNNTIKETRTLSLSDCYWLKYQNESVLFSEVTPYLHKEWDGTGPFKGGSISTLFVNGAANKRWLDSKTLLKVGSFKELEPYALCSALGINYAAKASLSKEGILLTNFTSTDYFLESLEQSGYIGENDNHLEKAVVMFKERAVALIVLDYLVEHDDRHSGNLGFIRCANTGKYMAMAPYYDFDWSWSDGVIPLPANAYENHSAFIRELCSQAKQIADNFEHSKVISKRAEELLQKVERFS